MRFAARLNGMGSKLGTGRIARAGSTAARVLLAKLIAKRQRERRTTDTGNDGIRRRPNLLRRYSLFSERDE